MKIACISDTHCRHNEWHDKLITGQWGQDLLDDWNDTDIVLHAGDISSYGYKHEVQQFCKWFNSLPQKEKIFIAGNHDFFFDAEYNNYPYVRKNTHLIKVSTQEDIDDVLFFYKDITYLNEQTYETHGLKIYGTPFQPNFLDWAFNRERGDHIKPHWDRIPEDSDVIVVHGPPHGILDHLPPQYQVLGEDPHVGCNILRDKIFDIKPKLVVCGHIHDGYGSVERDGIIFVNASCLNDNYRPVNPPQIIEL